MTTFTEALHPRGQAANAGQFRTKQNDAPSGSLTPASSPTAAAFAFLSAATPDGLTDAQRTAFEDAGAELCDKQLFAQQPISYIAFLAHQQHESAARMSGRVSAGSPDAAAYLATRAARADEIATELYRLAGRNRYPNRAPGNVGTDTRTSEEVLRGLFADHGDHLTMIDPEGVGATRAALTNRRGEPDGGVRLVGLSWASKPPTSGAARSKWTDPPTADRSLLTSAPAAPLRA